ncbi:hypothetical protein EKO04_000002 [Ascochyta lentis]|uniref:Rhodopsin domain-containing protein n=1 Tax=Ascochyta lentis TaxID=205686 RepID=A0A8H7JEM8_9PLEO|nr:hypothetical protein EKO04_000002 [Ascochyta lentis]
MLKHGDQGYMEENKGRALYSITFSFLAAAIFVVILRLSSRWCLLRARRTSLSETLIIAAVLVDVASCVLIHFQIHTGMGKHIEYSRARPAMLIKSMKIGLAQNTSYQALIGLIKLSILVQFYQLALPGSQKRVIVWVGVFVLVFTLFTVFAAIFQCVPMHAAWDLENFPKGCWNMMVVNFITSSVNTLLDVVIFVLPIPTMQKLQIAFKKKVTLVFAYAMGLVALACSIIRLRNIIHFNGEGDFTYVASMVPVWGAVECNAGIICASLPFVVPLFKWISGSAVESATGTSRRAHELQRSDKMSWPLNSRRQVDWHRMESESTENIRVNSGTTVVLSHATARSNEKHVEHC